MKKAVILIVLVSIIMLPLMNGTPVLAAKPLPFSVEGSITYISPSTPGVDVFPAGESGRWRVVEREIKGELGAPINSPFVMTYKANIESEVTQSGNLHGTLAAGDYTFKVNGKIQPLALVPLPQPVQLTEDWYIPMEPYLISKGAWLPAGFPMPKLVIQGHWSAKENGNGEGTFEAYTYLTTDMGGHVNALYSSKIAMNGKLN